jgi:uncharacterized protein (TIGR02246 family)
LTTVFLWRCFSIVAAVSIVCAGCETRGRTPPSARASGVSTVWRSIGTWSGRGNRQTESFTVETGALRLRWETRNERAPGAGTFRVSLHSAISGRPLQTIVERAGPGADTAYLEDDPRVSYLVIESNDIDWIATLEEAVPTSGRDHMSDDERAIRELVDTWMAATRAGDVDTVLDLMADDVIFMVPGQQPFGKEAFAAASRSMKDVQVEGTANIQELHVLGNWAYLRNYIEVRMTRAGAPPVQRKGYTLTILHKTAGGRWLLARDANLVT